MPRPPIATITITAVSGALVFVAAFVACSSTSGDTAGVGDAAPNVIRDSAPVDDPEGGPPLDGGTPPLPSCEKYCDLVTAHCTGDLAQYASKEECLAYCSHVPLVQPNRDLDEKKAASVACRQYWADTPARSDPTLYCLAAGPFGGNVCGDRCTAFCDVVLSACSPDGGVAAYRSQPECATACAGFNYADGGADGGGEGPTGPATGDTLNCRLYWLRSVTSDPQKCAALNPKSDVCKP